MTSRLSQGDLGLPSRKKTSTTEAKSKIPSLSSRQSSAGKSRLSSIGTKPGAVRSSLSSRLSTSSTRSSMCRSSVYGPGGSGASGGVKKDPRPLSDKNYQQACIKKLRTFLIEEQYPRDVKTKCLQSPSTKEFIFILNFILERLDPSLLITGLRIDEEIPFLLKFLKYPFTISKNHLLSVGSPHSWPIMLGFLMWLLDSLYRDMTSELLFPKQGEFDSEADVEESDFELTNELYREFLIKGPESDEYKELLETKQSILKKMHELCDKSLKGEKQVYQELSGVLQELQKSSIGTLKERLDEVHTKIEQKALYLNTELGPAIERSSDEQSEIHKEMASLETDIHESKETIRRLIEEIKTQPMSAREANELQQKIKERQDTRSTLKQRVEEARQGVFDLQRRHGNIVAQIDKECKEVNDSLRRLAAVTPDGQCIPILDYNTSKRADPSVLQELQQQAKSIKVTVRQLNERTAQEVADTETKIINAESAHSWLQTEVTTKRMEVESGKLEVSREKKQLEQLKKKKVEAMKSYFTTKKQFEDEIIACQEELLNDNGEETLAAITNRYNKECRKAVQCINAKTSSLQEICTTLVEYMEKQDEKQREIGLECEILLEEFRKIPPIKVQAKYCNKKP